jgi:nuclear transport factor 2 (NTF2) superfamily protein
MRIGLIIPFYIDVFFSEVSIRSSELDENGLMRVRIASINYVPIKPTDRKYH